jgi:hypothetical protein
MTTNWCAPLEGNTLGEISYALSLWNKYRHRKADSLPSWVLANDHIAGLMLAFGAAWKTNLLVNGLTPDEPLDYDCQRIAACHCSASLVGNINRFCHCPHPKSGVTSPIDTVDTCIKCNKIIKGSCIH